MAPYSFIFMTVFERNLKFLSLTSDIFILPKEHTFLNKYFKTKVQRAFLKYFYVFRASRNFTDHTGHIATNSFLVKLSGKFRYLLQEHEKAKKNFDTEKLALMQRGKFKVLRKFY